MAAYVFDTMTTTKTATTPTASRAGLFYELQYDTSASSTPTLIGAKLLDHRLERSRIAAHLPAGERNFHVLYYLLAGTSAAEKAHLGLDGSVGGAGGGQKRWKYLGHPTQLKVGIDDAEGFSQFKTALRRLEFPRSDIAEICQLLAAILHIGQLEFETAVGTTATADDSGGFSHEGSTSSTVVRNKDVLGIVAAFLGVAAGDLQATFGYRTKMIHKERVTVLLDAKGARANADEFARTLYALLVAYVIEACNKTICAAEEAITNTVSIIDFPGFQPGQPSTGSALDQLLNNAAAECTYNIALQSFFDRLADSLENEEVVVAATSYFDNSDATKGLLKPGNGLLSILDDQTRRNRTDMQLLESLRKRFEGKNPAITVGSATAKLPGSNFLSENTAATFTVRHFAGEVEYPVKGLVEENGEVISGDLMNLVNSSKSDFVVRLFGQEALQTVVHPRERTTVMQASVSSKPMRAPSVVTRRVRGGRPGMTRKNRDEESSPYDGSSDAGGDSAAAGGAGSNGNNRRTGGMAHSEQGASGQFLSSLEAVTRSVFAPNTNAYFVFCLKANDRRIANQFDSKCVRHQVQTFGIAEISQRLRSADFSVFLPFGEFLGLVSQDRPLLLVGGEREKAETVVEERQWPPNEVAVGATGVFLSERCWLEIAHLGAGGSDASLRMLGTAASADTAGVLGGGGDGMAAADPYTMSKERLLLAGGSAPSAPGGQIGERTRAGFFAHDTTDTRSEAGVSAFGGGDMFKNLDTREQMAERGNEKEMEEVEEYRDSAARKRWVFLVYLLTWYIPSFVIGWIVRNKRKDVQMAWREKLAINIIIWLSCALAAFFIIVFPMLLCPKQYVFSAAELSAYDGQPGSKGAYVSIRGQVFDIGAYAPGHYPRYLPTKMLTQYAGKDVSDLFPVQVSALCQGVSGKVDDSVTLDFRTANITDMPNILSQRDLNLNARYHDFRHFTNDSRPDWYAEQIIMLRSSFKKGNIGYSAEYVATLGREKKRSIAMLNGRVYDLTNYVAGGRRVVVKPGSTDPPPPSSAANFMDDNVVSLFQVRAGSDITQNWIALPIDPDLKERMLLCLDNLFYVGDVDTRRSARCMLAEYLVLAVSILLCSVIAFKFFAALQFGKRNLPEKLDRFVMCQIPAYTEDEESLRRAIDSAARMRYDDKRKLLVIICDGMIVGQGNDRPTPRIVLDILGVGEHVNPEPLSFESLGEGLKRHNMGKVYSGLYEVQGHIVPFLVIVKVGKPSEVSRPGNRGKRDSQMILMRFLNRVHYNLPMSPLELEMYHQIRNVIGVNPTFYEFLLQIDADTVVAPDSATRMVAAFVDDTRLIAVCGETALTNAKSSFITMIQVYEYYISHNLSKAFESLFGSVTCLPGCFSMYRIRAAETGKPLFVSREVVDAYATIRVDTLHMKNLLHLGEDRYLTTLLLKYHSRYKTKYIFAAKAWTIAPDSWKVFLSQRRRWINSTVHNLIELMPLNQLCGFCCFSMRFIVFVDLLSTIVQPVTIAYLVYLIALVIGRTTVVPLTAFVLLGAIYGLQAIIFILRRRWEMVGWMILYVAAIPVFSFGLPLYAFWHMDDFNWGNTRVVAGEKGRKIVVTDEGRFDPASIPRKRWEDYQSELLLSSEAAGKYAAGGVGGFDDTRSEVSGYSYATKYNVGGNNAVNYSGGPIVSEYALPPSRPGSVSGHPINNSNNATRMSLALSEQPGLPPTLTLPGNRGSQFGGSQFFGPAAASASTLPGAGAPNEMEMSSLALPSDDALLAEIRDILRTADLMTVTKKSVKQELERRFGVPLDAKRAYINSGKFPDPCFGRGESPSLFFFSLFLFVIADVFVSSNRSTALGAALN